MYHVDDPRVHPSPILEERTRAMRADLRLLEFAIVGYLDPDAGGEIDGQPREDFKAGCYDLLQRAHARLQDIDALADRLRKDGVEPIPREFWPQAGIDDDGGAR